MAYDYQTTITALMRRDGSTAQILRAKDRIDAALKQTGAMTYMKAMVLTGQSCTDDMLAIIDWFVGQGFYYRVTGVSAAAQDQIIVAKG